ncbi:hypothetical protein POM88_031057 [Heracleum sosnowskyi]|uniref:Transposase MuDR plant domain-containing protein n=1 Tax=Heracleum sosnowskyi TaxID=360622 RepID=A0AAD8HXX8_9APIA|nr:hypothetical protein POM88_031057 [Heracleum sosnowskyi]
MNVGNGAYNMRVEDTDNRGEYERNVTRTETRSKKKHDPVIMGEKPQWDDFFQYEREINLKSCFLSMLIIKNLGVKEYKKMQKKTIRTMIHLMHQALNHLIQVTMKQIIEFQPGMIFTAREHLRDSIRNYGVAKQRMVFMKRCDSKRMQAKCRDGCNWELWASKMQNDQAFKIKTYKKEHNCIIVNKQRMVKADWLAKQFGIVLSEATVYGD